MMYRSYAILLLLALGAPFVAHASSTFMITPSSSTAAPGDTVEVEVRLSTTEEVIALKFTVEYDTVIARFDDVRIGSGMPLAFQITNVNEGVGSGTSSPETNHNVLVQIFGDGGDTWVTGSDLQVAVLTFVLEFGACGSTPVGFDPSCNRTSLSNTSFQTVCSPGFQSGTLVINCASDAMSGPTPNLQLLQNVPNPFNPITVVGFEIAAAGVVQLRVFDASGQLVRTLVDGPRSAGWQSVLWDGRDDAGGWLPSGVYYYQLEAAGESQARRMLLLK